MTTTGSEGDARSVRGGGTTGLKLIINQEGKPPREYRFHREDVRIGRDPCGDVILWDPTVSRNHARIVRHSDSYVVEDLGSRNGVRVNAERLAERGTRRLSDGDRIQIGRSLLRFMIDVTRKITSKLLDGMKAETADAAAPAPTPPQNGVCLFRLDGLEATLLVGGEGRPAQAFALRSDITRIGSSAAMDIALADRSVSDPHAEIVYNAEGFHVVDRDSDHGTFVDGVSVRLGRISHRSFLRLGRIQALFVLRRRGEEPREASFGLRDHLLECYPEKAGPIQAVFRSCRERPIDFGAELVASGVLDPEQLWAASRTFCDSSSGLVGGPGHWLAKIFGRFRGRA